MADIETSFAGPTPELWAAARAIGEPFAQGTHTEDDWGLFSRVWDRVEVFSGVDLEGALASTATDGYIEVVAEGGSDAADLKEEAARAFFAVNEVAVGGIVGHLARGAMPEVSEETVDKFGLQIDPVLIKLDSLRPALEASDDPYEQAAFLLQVARTEVAARRIWTILCGVEGLGEYKRFMDDPTKNDPARVENDQAPQE